MNPRKSLRILLLAGAAALAACAGGPDSVAAARRVNAERPVTLSRPSVLFLIDMTDARLMDIEESRLALERATTPAVRDYADTMLREQPRLLADLRALALAANVVLPATIGADKRSGLAALAEANGAPFEPRYLRSIRIDHVRDVAVFRDAQDLPDRAIADFARRQLPLIQSHLDGVRLLERTP